MAIPRDTLISVPVDRGRDSTVSRRLLTIGLAVLVSSVLLPTAALGQTGEQQRCVTFTGEVPETSGEVMAALLRGELAISAVEDASTCGASGGDQPVSTDALYEASSAADFEEWELPGSWSVAGDLLVSSGGSFPFIGQGMGDIARPPVELVDPNYAVEVEMEILRSANGDSMCLFCGSEATGIVARSLVDPGPTSGRARAYAAGFLPGGNQRVTAIIRPLPNAIQKAPIIAEREVKFGPGYHTVRLEMKDNTYKMLVDGKVVIEGTDNQVTEPGWVGLFSNDAQVSVRRFAIYPL
jgi:hypothetical protein